MQMHFSFASSIALASGIQLHVFSHIDAGRSTAADVAEAAGASERGMRMLLDVLAAYQLLRKENGGYTLMPLASEYLVRGRENYLGEMREQGNHLLDAWTHLTDAVRSGSPPFPVRDQATAEAFFPDLVKSLYVINREPARRMAQLLGAGTVHRRMDVVDVGCGSGVFGIAIAEADPEARITAQDFPRLLDVTRTYIKRCGVEEQYEFLGGDLNEVAFGENAFDLALVGNVVHSEGERSSRNLFHKLWRALKPGGRIVVIDIIPNDNRTGPPNAVVFALSMLVSTSSGDTFTVREYTDWLKDAGFPSVESHDIGSHSPMIVAYKDASL